MATLTIRQLDDAAYDRLKARARANNRSLEAEARTLIEERTRTMTDFFESVEEFQRRFAAKHEMVPDSLTLLREMRDEE